MGMMIDRDAFLSGSGVKPKSWEALGNLLTLMETDPDVTDVRHFAYMLATVGHETDGTFLPIDEKGGDAYFTRLYEKRRDLGNSVLGDGARFHGRGFVQITGRRNYQVFSDLLGLDLVRNPAMTKIPSVAYAIMSLGMRRGLFTGKKLSDYLGPWRRDYLNARRIINGTDRAELIAGYARRFEMALSAAATSAPEPLEAEIVDVPTAPLVLSEPAQVAPAEPPAPPETPVQASVNSAKRMVAWLTSIGVGIGSIATAALNFVKENPVIAGAIIIVALVAVIVATGWYQHLLHKSDEDRRAYAADPDKNNVR